MYGDLIKALRICADGEHCDRCPKWEIKQNGGRNACEYAICAESADALEELQKRLSRAEFRLCDWCGVCPEDKRDIEDCEIAMIGPEYISPNWATCQPEPPKEET